MDILECPYCRRFPLQLHPLEQREQQRSEGSDRTQRCRRYCAEWQRPLTATELGRGGCGRCLSAEILRGVLRCGSCNRCYPIEDGIASLMPDRYRPAGELAGLARFRSQLPPQVAPPSRLPSGSEPRGDQTQEIEIRDRESACYDARYQREKFAAEMEVYQRLFDPRPGDWILELGCGTGRMTERLIDRCGHLIAVDFSLRSLEQCRRRLTAARRTKLTLLHADASLLPCRAGAFDQLLAIGLLCNLPVELHQPVRDGMARALRPAGGLLLSAYNYSALQRLRGLLRISGTGRKSGRKPDGMAYYNFTPRELRRWLEPAFEITELIGSDNRLPLLQHLSGRLSAALDRRLTGTRLARWLSARELTVRAIRRPER